MIWNLEHKFEPWFRYMICFFEIIGIVGSGFLLVGTLMFNDVFLTRPLRVKILIADDPELDKTELVSPCRSFG